MPKHNVIEGQIRNTQANLERGGVTIKAGHVVDKLNPGGEEKFVEYGPTQIRERTWTIKKLEEALGRPSYYPL